MRTRHNGQKAVLFKLNTKINKTAIMNKKVCFGTNKCGKWVIYNLGLLIRGCLKIIFYLCTPQKSHCRHVNVVKFHAWLVLTHLKGDRFWRLWGCSVGKVLSLLMSVLSLLFSQLFIWRASGSMQRQPGHFCSLDSGTQRIHLAQQHDSTPRNQT